MFAGDIEEMAKANPNFRQVLMTGEHAQVVAMSLPAGGDIGEETHGDTDQIFIIVDGEGEANVGEDTKKVERGHIVFVPAGILHNITSMSQQDMKLLTIYAPSHHPEGTVHATKEDAAASEAEEHQTAAADNSQQP